MVWVLIILRSANEGSFQDGTQIGHPPEIKKRPRADYRFETLFYWLREPEATDVCLTQSMAVKDVYTKGFLVSSFRVS